MKLADSKSFKSAKRVSRDHEPPGLLHFLPQLLDNQQLLDVLVKSKHQDIPLVRSEFIAPEYLYPSFTGEFVHLVQIPHDLMFGKADSVQFRPACLFNQFRGIYITAR